MLGSHSNDLTATTLQDPPPLRPLAEIYSALQQLRLFLSEEEFRALTFGGLKSKQALYSKQEILPKAGKEQSIPKESGEKAEAVEDGSAAGDIVEVVESQGSSSLGEGEGVDGVQQVLQQEGGEVGINMMENGGGVPVDAAEGALQGNGQPATIEAGIGGAGPVEQGNGEDVQQVSAMDWEDSMDELTAGFRDIALSFEAQVNILAMHFGDVTL